MKKITFISKLSGLLLGFSVLTMPITANAATPMAMDECAKELLLSYFPEQFVNETLARYNVPREKWSSINQALTAKDKEIIKIVEEKASQMNPNPIKDPQQRQAAVKLFRETLLKVFSDAMQDNGVTDDQNFQAMLDDIQKQKAKKFAQCMQKQKEQQTQSQLSDSQIELQKNQSIRSADDSDNDDDDDDDDDDNDDDRANKAPRY